MGFGIVLAAQAAAETLFLLAGGMIVDRISARQSMLIADIARLAAAGVLVLVPVSAPLWIWVALAIVMGLGSATFAPGYSAIVPALVSEGQLLAANSLVSVSSRAALIAGPVVAGILVTVLGTRATFGADALTFAVSVASLQLVPRSPRPAELERDPIHEAMAGFAEVRRHAWFLTSILVSNLHMALAVAPYVVLLPLVARSLYGGNVAYGALLSVFGAGGLVGALAALRSSTERRGFVAAGALIPLGALLLALALGLPLAATLVLALIAGAGLELFNVLIASAIQAQVPHRLLGRVSAIESLGSGVSYPLGLALAGFAVARGVSPSAILVAAGLVVVATAPMILLARGGRRLLTETNPGRE